jgi:hypothetical protein
LEFKQKIESLKISQINNKTKRDPVAYLLFKGNRDRNQGKSFTHGESFCQRLNIIKLGKVVFERERY